MSTYNNDAAAYYGNLARVAMRFYIATGNQAELNAAYWYARYAGSAAHSACVFVAC